MKIIRREKPFLEFKKDQIVNLNENELDNIKGGNATSYPCLSILVVTIGYELGQDRSYWNCPAEDFYVTRDEIPDVTCASIEEILVYGYNY